MQKKFSFDSITQNKIIRGAFIAVSGSGALALLDYLGTINIDNPVIASLIVFATPTLVNIIKEYMAGE